MLPTGPGRFTILGRGRSFRFALTGLLFTFRTQHNMWLHVGVSFIVVAAGLFFHLTSGEWCSVTLAIVAVWVTEILNTAFEYLCDVVKPEFDLQVQKAKDIAAGAVLIVALGATIVGMFIFIPHITARSTATSSMTIAKEPRTK
jgi:diacylglycerol kinase (ATP)